MKRAIQLVIVFVLCGAAIPFAVVAALSRACSDGIMKAALRAYPRLRDL